MLNITFSLLSVEEQSRNPRNSMYERARRRAEELIAAHTSKVPLKVINELNTYVAKKEKELTRVSARG